MKLSIIIVNYNVKFFLEHCLLSVVKACREITAEIIVVDNNSSDGSRDYLVPKFPSVKFIWNDVNVGFGKANNYATSIANGEHILFLNPDTILSENCLQDSLYFFEQNEDCGALGVRMIDGNGTFLKESKRCLPTPASGLFKMIGLTKLFPDSPLFAKYYAGHLREKENNKVEVLAGAFMMLSKKAFELTKGFDESFFMYGEDIDLSHRIIMAGLQNYYLGETAIIHFKGESTQKKDKAYIKHFYGAMKLFIDKHYNSNIIKRTAMSVAIASGKTLANLKNLSFQNKNTFSSTTYTNTLCVGDEQQLAKVKMILKHSSFLPTFYLNIKEDFKNEKIESFVKEKKITTIIWGESEALSNIVIINMMETLSSECNFLFYQNGALSIIGSHNKNERGIFISMQ